jgi:hypothetical protein
MRTRQLATSLVATLALTASALTPVLARADEAAPAGAALAQSSTERGESASPAGPALAMAALPPVDQVTEEKVWYGYQNLGADGAALALAIGGAAMQENGELLGVASLLTYALGSPIIHAVNGEGGRAAGSIALRLGLPLVLGGIGAATAPPCGENEQLCFNGLGEFVLGVAIGGVSAIVIDDFVLAHKTRRVYHESTWTPTVAPSAAGGMTFGVAGTF